MLERASAVVPCWRSESRASIALALALVAGAAWLSGCSWASRPADVPRLAADVQRVGPDGAGNRDAARAIRELSARPAGDMPAILAAMDGQGPLARNWLCGAADAVGERALREGKPLPVADLQAFVLDRRHDPAPRTLAFEWLARADSASAEALVPGFMDDPSTELRRLAVERAFAVAEARVAADRTAGIPAMHAVFDAARDPDQVDLAAKALEKLGEKPDLDGHYGVLRAWRVAGPFDNRARAGFEAVYPPEIAARAADLPDAMEGKDGASVAWLEHASAEPLGLVDFNNLLGTAKGVVAYASTTFHSPAARSAEVRASSPNALKIWVNGALVFRRDEYHHGDDFDQHAAAIRLREGENHILVKVCQNEQTEEWAGDWKLSVRLCDAIGGGI